MKNKAALTNKIKNAAIVLLTISAGFLLFKAVLNEAGSASGSLFNSTPETAVSATSGIRSEYLVTEPACILVTGKNGLHYAAKYDNKTGEKLLNLFSSPLGEALGTAGEPEEVAESSWREALKSNSVFFDYIYPQPLSFISATLGTQVSGTPASELAERLLLANEGEGVYLYYISQSSGKIYRCQTAASAALLAEKIAEYPVGTASFAFEGGEQYDQIDPYFIFTGESSQLRAIAETNPLDDAFPVSELLSLFGINARTTKPYTDAGGAVIYVDSGKSLRIDTDGRVLFSVTGQDGAAAPENYGAKTRADCLRACAQIVSSSIAGLSGAAAVGLTGITDDSLPASGTLNFGYSVDGIPVTLSGGATAARFVIRGGVIVRAELCFRAYTFTGNTLVVLPEKQAAAIAQEKGGLPLLTYEERAAGVTGTWIIQ